jgi:hypothetical protein
VEYYAAPTSCSTCVAGDGWPTGLAQSQFTITPGLDTATEHEDRTPTHGYAATREAAMAAFH